MAINVVDVPMEQAPTADSPGQRRLQRLLAADATAKHLGVSRATVERLVYRGQLPIVKIGRATRYDINDGRQHRT
jgi:excisionase family DNA binding protein